CQVGDRERGFCGVRENRDGVYYTLVYGSAAAANPDPIEKKPFFHFLPGTMAFSIATAGCNFTCKDCQNWELSQSRPEQVPSMYLPPAEVARQARANDCRSIAYTYNEPVIFYEYMHDTAVEARKQGVRSVVVSNGYIDRQPLLHLLPRIDAFKVDLKGFSEQFYAKYCSGTLRPVLETIKTVKQQGVWLEIVYLVVPTINDDPKTIEAVCNWLRDNVGREVPMHFSRFYPDYQLRNLPPTPYSTLQRCYKIAKSAGLHFVYLGNVQRGPEMDTYCPGCGALLIERQGFWVSKNRLKNGRCPNCGRKIPGVWS
ncbi:MAG: AmmeMemoRadiSam system radical SAM enzyme, partial [Armatimonadetes bacterium]|nr:AmmeMemoRadiSam system radical SAM enzyme [Armatimonadota bacterium]